MSSGFRSAGTTDAPIPRSDEWLAAQRELDANSVQRQVAARQPETKSLFETLEANKAAKQEAFEEANKIKHQFRALDEDEVEFLDSVLESTRAEEDRVRKETAEGLALFRQQQEEAEKKARENDKASEGVTAPAEAAQWVAAGRKRKRIREKEGLKGLKIRRSSSSEIIPDPSSSSAVISGKRSVDATTTTTTNQVQSLHMDAVSPVMVKKPPAKSSLGLVNYDSDE